MFNTENMIKECIDEPSLVFKYIRNGYYDIVDKLIDNNLINVNLVDCVGNDVVTRLLKARQYNLVEKLMKKRNWKVNHKNCEGNTFGHILAHDNSVYAVKVIDLLNKKKNYSPNIRNNKGESILDRALNNNYIAAAIKVIEDKRFNLIDFQTFKNLLNSIFKNKNYGKYARVNSLELIIDNLEKKELDPKLSLVLSEISTNMDIIKKDIMNNDSKLLYELLNQ